MVGYPELPSFIPLRRWLRDKEAHKLIAPCFRAARDCQRYIRVIEWIENDIDVDELQVPMFE